MQADWQKNIHGQEAASLSTPAHTAEGDNSTRQDSAMDYYVSPSDFILPFASAAPSESATAYIDKASHICTPVAASTEADLLPTAEQDSSLVQINTVQ